MAVTVISLPDNEINDSFNTDATFDSNKLIKNVWVNIEDLTNDTSIEITFNGVTITLNVTEECRFTPVNILFQNKEGAEQTLQFFKQRSDTLDTSRETFESDRGQPSLGNHQFVDFNVNGKAKFTVNSGFVSEDLNETFKQLFLSERVWWVEDATTLNPIKVSSTSLEFKTRQKDRLINYEVEFEFAFNEINTI